MTPIEIQYGALPYGGSPGVVLLAHDDHDGDKKVKAIATGFFALVPPFIVLISASHAFDDWPSKKMFVQGPNGTVPLPDGKLERCEEEDIAVIFFESSSLSESISHPFCVEPEQILDVGDSCSEAFYQMFGFPKSKSKYSHVTKWSQELMRVSFGRKRELPKRSKFSGRSVAPFCFELDLKKMYSDAGDKTNKLSELDGMSGSPVVRHEVEADRLMSGRLIGMFVEWCNQTKTSVVVPWANIERFVRSAASR